MEDKNIWENIDFKSNNKRVLDYLNEQAKFLKTSTSGILKMNVENVISYLDEEPIKLVQLYKLYVVSENLGNFRTKLLTLIQNNTGPEFPIEIFSHVENKKYPDVNEINFLDTLNEILSTSSVQNVIINLYKQSLPENLK